jgi:hypothetical protein
LLQILVSTLPEHEHGVLPALRPVLQENCLFEVNAVASTDAIGILEASLQRSGRRLQAEQLSLVLNSLKKAEDVTMLHVRLLHDRTVKWHSFDTVTAPPASVTGLIHSMFEDIERRSGVGLVTKVMGLMNAARAGLSEVSSSLLCALSVVFCLSVSLRTHHVSHHTARHSEAQSVYFTLFTGEFAGPGVMRRRGTRAQGARRSCAPVARPAYTQTPAHCLL